MFVRGKNKQIKGCLLLSLAWPADWSGRAIPDLPSPLTPGRSGVLSMAMYSVADINHDSTTRIPSSTSRVAPHGKQGASYEGLCGYWPFSKRMFTPVPRWGSPTHRGAGRWSQYIYISFKIKTVCCVDLLHSFLDAFSAQYNNFANWPALFTTNRTFGVAQSYINWYSSYSC